MAVKREIENAFARRMRRLLVAFFAGVAMMFVPGGIMVLLGVDPAEEQVMAVVALMVVGFMTVGIAGGRRAKALCPQCSRPFCGISEHPETRGMSVFTRSCMWCGYRPSERAI